MGSDVFLGLLVGKKWRGQELYIPGTPSLKCPIFLRQLETPQTSNYCIKNRALGFPDIYI